VIQGERMPFELIKCFSRYHSKCGMQILVIVFYMFLSYQYIYSQSRDIKRLNEIKNDLILKRKQINDSIDIINKKILDLKNSYYKPNTQNTRQDENYIKAKTRMDGNVKDKPEVFGNIVDSLNKGDYVKIISYKNGYWLIKTKRIKGYASEIYFNNNEKMKRSKKKFKQDKIIDKYGENIAYKIFNHKIWIGMTDKMARLSIGEPKEINRTTYRWGVHEQWVYKNRFLYFENGILKSWQD
jgi:hypothetical protein